MSPKSNDFTDIHIKLHQLLISHFSVTAWTNRQKMIKIIHCFAALLVHRVINS